MAATEPWRKGRSIWSAPRYCRAAGRERGWAGTGRALIPAAAAVVSSQVKKAVEALLAFARSKAKGDALLLNESENVHLLVTVWKIPRVARVIKM